MSSFFCCVQKSSALRVCSMNASKVWCYLDCCWLGNVRPVLLKYGPQIKTLRCKRLKCARGCYCCVLLAPLKVDRVAGRDKLILHWSNKINLLLSEKVTPLLQSLKTVCRAARVKSQVTVCFMLVGKYFTGMCLFGTYICHWTQHRPTSIIIQLAL